MPHPSHPDDELLAALADDDAEPDAAELRAHVAGCDRCGPLVDELRRLHVALHALPDLAPPRPLRLLPPVPEPVPARRAGWVGALRRLAAPVMALAVVMILVGAVGTAAPFGAGTAGALPATATDRQQAPGAISSDGRSNYESAGSPPVDTSTGGGKSLDDGEATQPARFPFELVLGLGVVLLAGAFVVRGFALRRGAG